MKSLDINCDVAVIGGGMAGLCAALAAARQGANTVLLQDRPVLGGNASSEVRMHIAGATRHGSRPNLRETGIIEEILLENKYINPEHSYGIFDTVLWEKASYQKNLSLYLNTYINGVKKEKNRIISVSGTQMTSEKHITVSAKQFIDCSGDGMISDMAGAEYMFGREGKDVFGEAGAVEKSDTVTMGNSIQFRTLDAGRPVPFKRPEWAYDYSNSDWVNHETWEEITSGYFWLEVGGTKWNVVDDAELTRDDLIKIVYGVWDYIKNYSKRKKEAENYYLDWVAFLPAKRESRRIVGDYILKEQDIVENRIFDDAVAYGGWHLDDHAPGGFYAKIGKESLPVGNPPAFNGIYTIPYRSLCAKGIDNLMLGGRIISASHRAMSSTRVMGTCAVVGEAAGVAAAIAARDGVSAAENIKNIGEIQQTLLKNGCYIPGFKNEDNADKARNAVITASSYQEGFEPENVINGVSRPVDDKSNMWQSQEEDKAPWISVDFGKAQTINKVLVTFDSNLSVEIMPSLSKWHHVRQAYGIPDTIVKDFTAECLLNGNVVCSKGVNENHQRLCSVDLSDTLCDTVRIKPVSANGCDTARICEIRIY